MVDSPNRPRPTPRLTLRHRLHARLQERLPWLVDADDAAPEDLQSVAPARPRRGPQPRLPRRRVLVETPRDQAPARDPYPPGETAGLRAGLLAPHFRASLTRDEQVVLVFHYVEHLTVEEVAVALRREPAEIESMLRDLRARARRMLAGDPG